MNAMVDDVAGSESEPQAPKSRRKLVVGLVVLLLLGGGYWFSKPEKESAPKPGEVMTLEPLMLNLADERYLKVGLALQLVEGAEEVDGAPALDAMIEMFSGLPISRIDESKERKKVQAELTSEIKELYEAEVLDTYFVLFVTQ